MCFISLLVLAVLYYHHFCEMCRFLLYQGPKVVVSKVVIDPDHGMLQQSSKALCPITPLNADGFGIAWYAPSVSRLPACFRETLPAWSSQNLKQITRVTKSTCIFAHVRAASTGNVIQTNCHPFIYKSLTFMHNGTVPYYKDIKRSLSNTISDRAFNMIQGTTDSEMLFAMFITHFEQMTGENKGSEDEPYSDKDHTQTLAAALRATLQQVHKTALEYEIKVLGKSFDTPLYTTESDGADTITRLQYTSAIGRLNLAVTDGQSSVTSRYTCSHPSTAHTLYYTRGDGIEFKNSKCCVTKTPTSEASPKPGMVIVSSEPLGAQFECEVVPPNHMVIVGPNNYFDVEAVGEALPAK